MKYFLHCVLFSVLSPLFCKAQIINYGEDKSRYEYALGLYNAAKFSQAAEYCTDILTHARSSEVFKLRAMSYRGMGDYERSALDYSEAIQVRKDAQLYFDRALVYLCQKQFDKAELDLNEAVRLFKEQRPNYLKDNFSILEERGRVYYYLGYYKDAISDFRLATENGSFMATIDLLSALFRNKEFDEINQTCKSLLQQHQANPLDLLSDRCLYFYISSLKAITDSVATNQSLSFIEQALSYYHNNDTRCFQGFYYDLLSTKAYIQSSLGYDSASYDLYKKVFLANNKQADIKRRLDELKIKLGIDALPPAIAIKNPQVDANNTVTIAATKSSIEIYGSVTDSSGVASLLVNNRPVAKIEDDGLFVSNVELKPGRNDVLITAIDKNENKSEKNFVINVIEQSSQQADTSGIPELFNTANYFAILIAEKDYQDVGFNDLEAPVKDAMELKDILMKQYLFDEKNIALLSNPDRTSMLDTIRAKCENLSDQDNLLIFYAGHGMVRKIGSNIAGGYIVPSDAKKGSWNTYVSSEDLKSAVQYSASRHILFVVDACFGGALFRSIDDAPDNIKSQYNYKSRRLLTSGNLEEVQDNGKFIKNFKEFLINNTQKYTSASELYNFLMKNAETSTPRYDRIPDAGDSGGHFIFIRR
jgi:tetratricopeptide (TPR) repeat protein